MIIGVTIAASVLITVVLTLLMYYTTKKGYSRKWDED